jgi:hypothetical protein
VTTPSNEPFIFIMCFVLVGSHQLVSEPGLLFSTSITDRLSPCLSKSHCLQSNTQGYKEMRSDFLAWDEKFTKKIEENMRKIASFSPPCSSPTSESLPLVTTPKLQHIKQRHKQNHHLNQQATKIHPHWRPTRTTVSLPYKSEEPLRQLKTHNPALIHLVIANLRRVTLKLRHHQPHRTNRSASHPNRLHALGSYSCYYGARDIRSQAFVWLRSHARDANKQAFVWFRRKKKKKIKKLVLASHDRFLLLFVICFYCLVI